MHEDVHMEEVPGYKAFPGNLSNEMYLAGVTSEAKSKHNHAKSYRTEAGVNFQELHPQHGQRSPASIG